jgi:DNA (cytosine-5)-methyltransferase 1
MRSFIDLCAGLGGFRIGLERNGYQCVYASDNNKHAAQVYEANFGHSSYGDVTNIDPTQLPDFDILCAGFPCQPFSRAGFLKGFEDTRGTLFFDICRILEEKKPKAIFLENVRNLATHDGGRTLEVIIRSLEDLGYSVSTRVMNALDFGVPQSRERILIVGSLHGEPFDFDKVITKERITMKAVLEQQPDEHFEWLTEPEFTLLDEVHVSTKKSSGLRFVGYRNKAFRNNGAIQDNAHHSRTHRQPNRIYHDSGTHSTLSAGEKSGRYFIQTQREDGSYGVRKLTLLEGLRMFGYPDDYQLVGPVGEQWARIGNSICVPMVQAVMSEISNQILHDTAPDV